MIERFEVDGIPALFTPTEGPLHAGLVFRVGMVDEPLSRRGITHLVEHLALHSLGVTDYHFNGATGEEVTYFQSQGSEADVVGFLNGVGRNLHDLPMQRLATEKEILRTEQNGRGLSADEPLAVYRYGARGYGLHGYPELGLSTITPADLRRWTDWYFSRSNAALWIAGDRVPTGLRLNLPSGSRRPLPPESSALPERPAFFYGPQGVVGWNAVVRRTPAAELFPGVLQRALFRSLRQEGGYSYAPQADSQSRGRDRTLISAVADALPEKQDAVLGGFVDVLASLRFAGIDPAEVAAVVNRTGEQLIHAARRGALLPGQAADLITGRPVQDLDALVAAARSVTAGEVHAVAIEAYADGLLMAPRGTRADWTGYTPAPTSSTGAVTGTAYPAIGEQAVRLVIGQSGVSMVVDEPEKVVTVRFDACAALLAYPDGARTLIGHDAISVQIEPTLFANAGSAVPYIDSRVHPDMRVELPARDESEIPQPAPPKDEDEYCCDDECCPQECCDGDCCSDDDCPGKCCIGKELKLRTRVLRRLRR
jgi:zinc protease